MVIFFTATELHPLVERTNITPPPLTRIEAVGKKSKIKRTFVKLSNLQLMCVCVRVCVYIYALAHTSLCTSSHFGPYYIFFFVYFMFHNQCNVLRHPIYNDVASVWDSDNTSLLSTPLPQITSIVNMIKCYQFVTIFKQQGCLKVIEKQSRLPSFSKAALEPENQNYKENLQWH